jgi:hypothetical protein
MTLVKGEVRTGEVVPKLSTVTLENAPGLCHCISCTHYIRDVVY